MQKKRLPTLLDLIHPHLKLYLKIVESKENMSGFLYRFSLIEKEKEAYVNIFKTDKIKICLLITHINLLTCKLYFVTVKNIWLILINIQKIKFDF